MKEIFERRSIRKYTDQPIEEEKVEKLLRAAMQSPSAGNQQAWEFIVVTDKELLEKLGGICQWSAPLAKAPLAFVVLGNTTYMHRQGLWTHDMGAACQNIQLEAKHLGLGAVWVGVESREDAIANVREIFPDIPEEVKPFSVLGIGYPDEMPPVQDRFKPERIHYNKY